MIEQTHGNCSILFCDGGLPEVMRTLDSRKAAFNSGGPADVGRGSFYQCTWDEALKLAHDGWHEGAMRIARGFPAPTFGKASRKPKWGFDVAGDLPDVGRYLSGHPDAMRRRKADKGRQPVVVLYIGNGIRADVSTTAYTNFGIAVCELIDALENSGTRVELNQLTRAEGGPTGYMVTGWRVKEAADPLDLSAVAFTFMHPGAHRRIQFQLRARIEGGSVGGSTSVAAKHFPDAPANALVFAGISEASGSCHTLPEARRFLQRRINAAAGHELISDEMLAHLTA